MAKKLTKAEKLRARLRKETRAKNKAKKKTTVKKKAKVTDSLFLRLGAKIGKALAPKKSKKDDNNPIF